MAITRLNDELTEAICQNILAGQTDKVSALLVGVPERTFQHWMTLGSTTGKKPYAHFYQRVSEAHAEIEERMVAAGYSPLNPDPETARLWLSKRRRRDWGNHQEVEHSGELVTRVVFRLPEVGDADNQDA